MSFKIPEPLKIALLVVGATVLYTYIGQLVPQKVVHPPVETQMSDDMTTEELTAIRDAVETAADA